MPSEPRLALPSAPPNAATSLPLPQQPPSLQLPSREFYGTPPLIHYGAIAITVLGPVALLLPPRRLSFQNVILSFGASWGANQVVHDFTGKSLYQRSRDRWAAFGSWGHALPPAAERNHKLIEAEKEARRKRQEVMVLAARRDNSERAAQPTEQAAADQNQNGVLHRLWMGDEQDDWKKERLAKEREALEEGKGYWDIITEHVSEAFNPKGKKRPGSDVPPETGREAVKSGDESTSQRSREPNR